MQIVSYYCFNVLNRSAQFLGKLESTNKETFGFKTRNCPPTVEELNEFESDMMALIHNIEFKRVCDEFQSTMKKDSERKLLKNN